MNYPISPRASESISVRSPGAEELILNAIAVVIETARSQGQSLEEIKAEVLADDAILDAQQRQWLSDIVTQAWQDFPHSC
ncbi:MULTISPECIES: hypothetical protein [Leptolyngbya]|jgi:hypothetical protein|uniref:Uncharacterized protein n=2 Tax=Leptolyngbya boryana TaxID=1184 RepID=A0A1Z4JAJ5_LEPBY|nr:MULTISPECIES: hypothetical protein [Leptolyngbya]BAY53776.1 hypothetical protein NIES2135_05870 [Leptolyngbya boryana NIES-2135]MBD1858222.1 hypothetical protein [Leptolyngbya sp. FACHB-1624]MBD2367783.1 hypothetical protein [Leptolyngbya sp. FACHB-161]MBD2374369.1 hypothetical protein [Leptolyngbya sp. FACHB-238]MBD2398591.1 hypothetical protein [Leptolyngbya sp. FACHB-239]